MVLESFSEKGTSNIPQLMPEYSGNKSGFSLQKCIGYLTRSLLAILGITFNIFSKPNNNLKKKVNTNKLSTRSEIATDSFIPKEIVGLKKTEEASVPINSKRFRSTLANNPNILNNELSKPVNTRKLSGRFKTSKQSQSGLANNPKVLNKPVNTRTLSAKLGFTSRCFSNSKEIDEQNAEKSSTTFQRLRSGFAKIFNVKRNKELDFVVKCTGKLYDDSSIIPTYQTRSPEKRGRLLLINNIEFEGERRRNGADVDQRNIVMLFEQIGFETDVHKNQTKHNMEAIVTNFATAEDLKTCDVCMVVLMSHGTIYHGETVIESIDGFVLSTEWVVQQFDGNKCKGMRRKSKIFMFLCCRGTKENTYIRADPCGLQRPKKLRQVQDVLICYSTIPGFGSYRHWKQGSPYFQALCTVFAEHCHDTPIEDLLKIVDKKLEKWRSHSGGQTSSYENRGFKRCYLHPIGE